jgi:hypothetical protein
MGFHNFDVLRVSPKFTTKDWEALDINSDKDWPTAADIIKDRLDGRFLGYARSILESPQSGFVVLAIDCLVVETLQQFRLGVTDGNRQSKKMITGFLQGKNFQPHFDKDARDAFYQDIRCGLLHQAEAREMWLIRRDQKHMLTRHPEGGGYVIDVQKFHDAVELSFTDYLKELTEIKSNLLRYNLWMKMGGICNVRNRRGISFAEGS